MFAPPKTYVLRHWWMGCSLAILVGLCESSGVWILSFALMQAQATPLKLSLRWISGYSLWSPLLLRQWVGTTLATRTRGHGLMNPVARLRLCSSTHLLSLFFRWCQFHKLLALFIVALLFWLSIAGRYIQMAISQRAISGSFTWCGNHSAKAVMGTPRTPPIVSVGWSPPPMGSGKLGFGRKCRRLFVA